jgi:hypothetical protein
MSVPRREDEMQVLVSFNPHWIDASNFTYVVARPQLSGQLASLAGPLPASRAATIRTTAR